MKRIISSLLTASVLMTVMAGFATANTIVILKWSAPVSSTIYEVENASANGSDPNDGDGDGKPYPRKKITYSQTWAYYDIYDVTTGEIVSIDYRTTYQSPTVPIKEYFVGAVRQGAGWLARSTFLRAPSPNTAPTYNFVDVDLWSTAEGGPDDPASPGNLFRYEQVWSHMIKLNQALATIIPAKTTPPTPAVKVLLPSGATGPHQGFIQELFYPGPVGSLNPSPSNKRYIFETGTATLSYDSVRTAKANAPLAANVHVFDQNGVEVFPGTLAYSVKLVRDALEALGYEIVSDFDFGP
jgi:hypothetical protein